MSRILGGGGGGPRSSHGATVDEMQYWRLLNVEKLVIYYCLPARNTAICIIYATFALFVFYY